MVNASDNNDNAVRLVAMRNRWRLRELHVLLPFVLGTLRLTGQVDDCTEFRAIRYTFEALRFIGVQEMRMNPAAGKDRGVDHEKYDGDNILEMRYSAHH